MEIDLIVHCSISESTILRASPHLLTHHPCSIRGLLAHAVTSRFKNLIFSLSLKNVSFRSDGRRIDSINIKKKHSGGFFCAPNATILLVNVTTEVEMSLVRKDDFSVKLTILGQTIFRPICEL